MTDQGNRLNRPDGAMVGAWIQNPLWENFLRHIQERCCAAPSFEFSTCSQEHVRNARFKKRSRSLRTVYPRAGYFTVMIVIGKRERTAFDRLCPATQKTYREGNGQRELRFDVKDDDEHYADVKPILNIRIM